MCIEFTGLPGSGKTTLSFALVTHLQTLSKNVLSRNDAVLKCIRRRDDGYLKNVIKRFPYRFWQTLMGPKFSLPEFVELSSRHLELVSFISETLSRSNLPELLVQSIWNTVARTFAEYQIILPHIHQQELFIMDEAFSQRCFTLFGYIEQKVPDESIKQYASMAPISDHLIWVRTPPQICVERFMSRYQTQPVPFDFKLDPDELLGNFESGEQILEKLCTALEKQGKHIYQIRGDQTKSDAVKEICSLAPKFLNWSAPPFQSQGDR